MASIQGWQSKAVISVLAALCFATIIGERAMAVEGLTTLKSAYSPAETMARLKEAVTSKGMTVFAHVDHAAGAREAGLPLRATDLLIFGSPKGGTAVMQSVQTAGIDLPLKALVWEDNMGTTWLSYNTPVWSASRHSAGAPVAVRAMTAAIEAVAAAATSTGPPR
jgi:uncharacterized protein (DUF302 family)